MKVVQVAHSWRRVSEEWPGQHVFSRLHIQDARGFVASEVALHGGVCIVAGINSGGKSRLIRSIHNEFEPDQSSFTSLIWEKDAPAEAILVDFFDLLIREANLFQITDLGDLVSSVGLTPISSKKLKNINWVLGREYSNVSFAELENPNELESASGVKFRPDVVPYFQVTHQSGEKFNSESLSRGELAVLTLSWVLDSLEPGTLYLFDEPDLMLSPHSSERAIDLLINKVNDLKTPAFIATHSYHTIASVPESLLLHVNVGLEGYSVASRPNDAALWKTLKVAAPIKVAFVVEDKAASALLKAILPDVSPKHGDLSAIWIAGDAAKVTRAGKFPVSSGQTIQIWGVLDGNEPEPDRRDNILKLPGGLSPEEGALMILREHPHILAVDPARASELLARQAGVDPHDSVREIAAELGFDHLAFIVFAWKSWFRELDVGQEALKGFQHALLERVPV